jgi:2-(1,2-epoxy-1,2-dihydrophenyl)acetyl-CoA isomerase
MAEAEGEVSVKLERRGQVGIVTLNETASLNALSQGIKEGMMKAVENFLPDDAIRAIMITANGRAFCAGGDLRTMDEHRTVMVRRRMQATHDWVSRLLSTEKPVLTAVNGVAAGAGLSLALMGDIVCAASDARFKAGFPGVGAAPDLAVVHTLSRAIGEIRAKDILLTNRDVSADEAFRLGFVSRLFAPQELFERTLELATSLAAGPYSLGLTKRLIARAHETTLEAFLEDEAHAQTVAFGSEDFKEGVAAFRAKRKPVFTGR